MSSVATGVRSIVQRKTEFTFFMNGTGHGRWLYVQPHTKSWMLIQAQRRTEKISAFMKMVNVGQWPGRFGST